jgi:integrase
MAIKLNESDQTYEVSYYKRHPITRVPIRAFRVGIKTQAEAKRVYAELVVQVADKLKEQVVPRWRSFIEEYFKASLEKDMAKKTVDNYAVCLRAHTLEDWGNRRLDSFTTQQIRELIKTKVGDRSPGTQKSMLKIIRGVFKYAVETGVLTRNPTPEMKFRTGDKIRGVLTEPQVQILLSKARDYGWEWYPHVAVALYTGMRNGEIYALTWDKVDLNERKILVDCSWNSTDGLKSTKTGDDRIVEIAPPLLVILRELKLKTGDSVFVLPRLSQWDTGYQASALRTFLVGLGLPPVRFHDLRATWATIMLSKGVQPAKVMVMGGWKDMKTMMIYTRKAGIDIRGITDCLNLHDPTQERGQVLDFVGSRSNL